MQLYFFTTYISPPNFFMAVSTFLTKEFSLPAGVNKYPIKEAEFIKINNLKGKIFANFNYGSFLSYKLYPNNLIYMDGRYEEVYPDYMLPMQIDFFKAEQGWERVIKLFPPDIIILEKNYPAYKKIEASKDWKLVYEGRENGIFVRSNEVKPKYLIPNNDINYYKNSLFDTSIKFK